MVCTHTKEPYTHSYLHLQLKTQASLFFFYTLSLLLKLLEELSPLKISHYSEDMSFVSSHI